MRRIQPVNLVGASLAAAFVLTSCGSGQGGAGGNEEVEIRFSWFGSDTQHQISLDMIEAFEAEHPHISIEGEYTEWDSYWDQLATQAAAQDIPDVMMMDDRYIRDYADRGVLLDLQEVDVSAHDPDVVANGETDEGLFGVTTGINTQVLMANPRLFEEAGFELPDDTSWTWEEYAELTRDLSEELEDAWGASNHNEPGSFQIWLRQQGKHLTTEEAELGFEEGDAEEYLQLLLDLREGGSLPPADLLSEVIYEGSDQSLTGTARAALGPHWSNQLPGLQSAVGEELIPLRWPSESGDSGDHGMWHKSAMMLTASAHTDHPEEVQMFIDYMVNSPEAGEMAGVERGLPANLEVREHIMDDLDEADSVSVEIVVDIEDEISGPEPVPAVGFSTMQEILRRYQVEVFFERITPEEAAGQMLSEMQDVLD